MTIPDAIRRVVKGRAEEPAPEPVAEEPQGRLPVVDDEGNLTGEVETLPLNEALRVVEEEIGQLREYIGWQYVDDYKHETARYDQAILVDGATYPEEVDGVELEHNPMRDEFTDGFITVRGEELDAAGELVREEFVFNEAAQSYQMRQQYRIPATYVRTQYTERVHWLAEQEWHVIPTATYTSTTTGGSLTVPFTSTQNATMRDWITSATSNYYTVNVTYRDEVFRHWIRQQNETEEQIQAREDAEQRAREEQNARRLEAERRAQQGVQLKEQAQQRGMELLRFILSEEQRKELLEHDYVTVRGNAGGLYIVHMARETVHGNIQKTDEHGCNLGSVCVAPRMRTPEGRTLPTSDGWVGQVLGLMCNEIEFLSHGNWSRVRACLHPEVPSLVEYRATEAAA